MSQRIEVERTVTAELTRDQDEISERLVRTNHLHRAYSSFLERQGELIGAKRLLTGRGFDSYMHRRLSFSTKDLSGGNVDVTLRALESPRNNIIVVDLSNRNDHLLISPTRLYERQPPTPEDLDLLEYLLQRLKRVIHNRLKKHR